MKDTLSTQTLSILWADAWPRKKHLKIQGKVEGELYIAYQLGDKSKKDTAKGKRKHWSDHRPELSPIQLAADCSQHPLYTLLVLYLETGCLQPPGCKVGAHCKVQKWE